MESAANKYTFVWKGTTVKNREKLVTKISLLYQDLLKEYGAIVSTLGEAKTMLEKIIQAKEKLSNTSSETNCAMDKNKPPKASKEQKYLKVIEEYCAKLQKYAEYTKVLGERNSFSKTDNDATFMRMKEDAMRNGQLKPAYNLQIAVSGEYIVSCMASSERNDNLTLEPFVDKMKSELSTKFSNISADSGYESESNYEYLKRNNIASYIKPTNYEISKTRKYKQDKSKRENMDYNETEDFYVCQNKKKLLFTGWEKRKTKSGHEQNLKNYECESCDGCEYKSKCTKAKGNRVLQFSPRFQELREESLRNIVSEYGTQLRINRSIQVEGAFGVLKGNYAFRRFLMRGQTNITTEFTLLCFAYNIKKLHAKTQSKRNRTYLHNLN